MYAIFQAISTLSPPVIATLDEPLGPSARIVSISTASFEREFNDAVDEEEGCAVGPALEKNLRT